MTTLRLRIIDISEETIMVNVRNCSRCEGEEFSMSGDSGATITWSHAASAKNTWFCPACDWGTPPRAEREKEN